MDLDIHENAKRLMKTYLEKLNHNDEYISTMFDVIDTIETILQRFEVRQQTIEWDHKGVQLDNGNVILPDGMQEVIDEIVIENLLYSFFLPEKFGGLGSSGFMIGPLTEKLAMYDMPLQMLIMVGFTMLEALLLYYDEAFDKVINEFSAGERIGGYVAFTEPGAGSNLKNIKATSEKVGDEYVLNGTKIFISNGGYANTGLFLCRNMVDGEADGTNVFLVDNLENITVDRLEEKTGLHANPTAQLTFDNVTVPANYLIAKRGEGYQKVLERILGMRVAVSFQGLAATKRSYQLSRNYAETRKQFDRPIIQFPAIQRKLKSMVNQIPRMEEYAYKSAYALERYLNGWVPADVGARGKNLAEKTAAKMVPGMVRGGIMHYYASSSKIYCTEIANNIVYDAVQIFGGSGYITEMEVNKISRDTRVLSIYEGTSEIQEWILGRSKKATGLLPRFKRTYEQWDETTVHERYLFDRFPDIRELI